MSPNSITHATIVNSHHNTKKGKAVFYFQCDPVMPCSSLHRDLFGTAS